MYCASYDLFSRSISPSCHLSFCCVFSPAPLVPNPLCLSVCPFVQDQLASYDVNGNDPDPTPRYDSSNENK